MKKRKIALVLYIVLSLIIVEFGSRCFLIYHKLRKAYLSNAKYYEFSGNFWQYTREYLKFKKKYTNIIIEDDFNRRFYVPSLSIESNIMRDFKTNSYGMWEKNINPEKEENIYRIICFGSSYTRGTGGVAFPELLEEKLNNRGKEKKFEVINTAISGQTILNAFMDFALNWRMLNPDMIIIDDVFEDIEVTMPFYLHNYKQALKMKKDPWGKIRRAIGICGVIDLLYDKATFKYDKPEIEALEYYKSILGSFVLLAKGMGCKVVLLSCGIAVDNEHNFDENNRMVKLLKLRFFSEFTTKGIIKSIGEYNKVMKDVAVEEKAVFIDMSNAVPKDEEHYTDASHRSGKGNEVFANVLFEKLIENKCFE